MKVRASCAQSHDFITQNSSSESTMLSAFCYDFETKLITNEFMHEFQFEDT